MTITDKQIEAAQDAYRKHVAEHGVEGSAEAMRAAIEAADAVAWLPIESAPKGSAFCLTEIFFVCGRLDANGLYIAKARDRGEGPAPMNMSDDIDDDIFFSPQPTHWRPLPTPPKGE